jgi:predicted DNA-binding transcriptional regulator YafY
MDKWEKIVTLHRLLKQSRYSVPLTEILEAIDCSTATFHRLRSYLQNVLGAPLEFDARYKGYRYAGRDDAPFELPGLWLTQTQIEALLLCENAFKSLRADFFNSPGNDLQVRLHALLKAHKIRLHEWRDRLKIVPIASRTIDEKVFRIIAEATLKSKRLFIEHLPAADNQPQNREISPQALIYYRDNWYVDAYCHLRNDLRTFAVDRIIQAKCIKGKWKAISAEQRSHFFSESYGIFSGLPQKLAVIRFTGTAARIVSREQWHPKQQGKTNPDGTYTLSIPYSHDQELIMDILRWGPDAEALEPPDLRSKINSLLRAMLQKYER